MLKEIPAVLLAGVRALPASLRVLRARDLSARDRGWRATAGGVMLMWPKCGQKRYSILVKMLKSKDGGCS